MRALTSAEALFAFVEREPQDELLFQLPPAWSFFPTFNLAPPFGGTR